MTSSSRWFAPILLATCCVVLGALLRREFLRDPGAAAGTKLETWTPPVAPAGLGRDLPEAPTAAGRPRGAPVSRDVAGAVADVLAVGPGDRPLAYRGVGLRRRGEAGRRLAFTAGEAESSGDALREGEARFDVPAEFEAAFAAGELEAFVRTPGASDTAAAVPPPVDGVSRVRLRAAPGMTARVVITDTDGAPLPARTPMTVRVGSDADASELWFSVVGGTAKIGGLPARVPVRFDVRFPDRERREVEAVLDGDPESTTDVAVCDGAFPASLVGEVAGVARAGRRIRAVVRYGSALDGASLTLFSKSDAAGRFRVPVPARGDATVEAALVDAGPDGPARRAPRVARVPIVHKGAEIPLGALADDAPPVVVEGRVLRAGGPPAEGALVVVEPLRGGESRDAAAVRSAAITDDTGSYKVRGAAPEPPFRVVARWSDGDDFESAERDVDAAGAAAPIDLALQAGGRVVGRVDLPRDLIGGGAEPSRAYAIARAADGATIAYKELDPSGEFALSAPAGRYDVVVFAAGLRPLTIPDVEVRSGAAASDLRLSSSAFAAEFCYANVRVTRADASSDLPERVAGAVVTASFPPDAGPPREPLVLLTDRAGFVRVPFEAGTSPELIVEFDDPARWYFGYRAARVRVAPEGGAKPKAGAEADVAVKLAPGAEIEFAPDAATPDLPSDVSATYVLDRRPSPEAAAATTQKTVWARWTRGRSEARIAALPDGRWRVRLELAREGRGRDLRILDLGELLVRDSDRRVVHPVRVAAAIADWLKG